MLSNLKNRATAYPLFLYPLGTNAELMSEILLMNQLRGDSLLLLALKKKKNHLPFEKMLHDFP